MVQNTLSIVPANNGMAIKVDGTLFSFSMQIHVYMICIFPHMAGALINIAESQVMNYLHNNDLTPA